MPRNSILDTQRRALRIWYRTQHPRPSHKGCIAWFRDTFHFKISQSTVSESLSDKFKALDDATAVSGKPSYRRRQCQWPLLEKLLYEWQQRMEKEGKHCRGELLVIQAQALWTTIPEYQNKPVPEFSSGWVTRFKGRHNIRYRLNSRKNDEAVESDVFSGASRNHTPQTTPSDPLEYRNYSSESYELKELCKQYDKSAIYNVHACRIRLDDMEGSRSSITLISCVNASGEDRLPLMFVGTPYQVQILDDLEMGQMEALWNVDPVGNLNDSMMKNWLEEFYHHMSERKVLLTLERVNINKLALKLIPPPSNIKIAWLPPTRNEFFPLGQSIAKSLAFCYYKHFLEYTVSEDSPKSVPVSLPRALIWLIEAWQYNLPEVLIIKHFEDSLLVSRTSVCLDEQIKTLQQLYSTALAMGCFRNLVPFTEFIDSIVESLNEPLNSPIVQETASCELPTPSLDKALEAIKIALRFQSSLEDANPEDVNILKMLESQWTLLGRNRKLLLQDYLVS